MFGYQCFLGCFGKPHTKQLPRPTLGTTGLATSTKRIPGYIRPGSPSGAQTPPTQGITGLENRRQPLPQGTAPD